MHRSSVSWELQEDDSSAWLIGAYSHHDPTEDEIHPYSEPPKDPRANRSPHNHHQQVILPCWNELGFVSACNPQ